MGDRAPAHSPPVTECGGLAATDTDLGASLEPLEDIPSDRQPTPEAVLAEGSVAAGACSYSGRFSVSLGSEAGLARRRLPNDGRSLDAALRVSNRRSLQVLLCRWVI